MNRLIIGISGASGVIYGVRLLQVLRDFSKLEIHLLVSQSSCQTLSLETNYTLQDVQNMADVVHNVNNIAASISSGSFETTGMIILPCSIKTLSSIANSYTDTLMSRAADVVIKENRRLVLCVRETPLHLGHLRMMLQAAKMGATIMPLIPSYYQRPQTLEQVIDQMVGRVLQQFSIDLPENFSSSWRGRI